MFSSQTVDFRWFMWLTKPNLTLEQDFHKLVPNSNYTRYCKLVSPLQYESIRKDMGNSFLSGVRMNLFNVTEKDQGYYSCVMCHRGGCAVNTANLTVFQYNGMYLFQFYLMVPQSLSWLVLFKEFCVSKASTLSYHLPHRESCRVMQIHTRDQLALPAEMLSLR